MSIPTSLAMGYSTLSGREMPREVIRLHPNAGARPSARASSTVRGSSTLVDTVIEDPSGGAGLERARDPRGGRRRVRVVGVRAAGVGRRVLRGGARLAERLIHQILNGRCIAKIDHLHDAHVRLAP